MKNNDNTLYLFKYLAKNLKINNIYNIRKFFLFSSMPKFYIVGTIGFLINLIVSTALASNETIRIHYLLATGIGIWISLTSNFILNKIWTFNNKHFDFRTIIFQYSKYIFFSIIGIGLQLGIVYLLVESGNSHFISLVIAIIISSFSNYLLNKKFTFNNTIIEQK